MFNGILDAKYLNPECGINGCQWLRDFRITIDEARALNYLLRLHEGLMKQSPEQHIQILRVINGLGNFINEADKK